MHVDGASGAFVWPFLYPDSAWDFRLETVRSINVSGHKYGLVYPGLGWLIFRERSDLPEDLVFYENYLGKRDMTFTLNFSTGSSMVLAQYYNFVRYGHEGYRYIMESMQRNARALADEIVAHRRLRAGRGRGRRAAAAGRVQARRGAQLRRVRHRVAARRRARLDAARLHAAAERRARDDHARAGQALARPLARHDARRRHRARPARRSPPRAACTSSTAGGSRPAPATDAEATTCGGVSGGWRCCSLPGRRAF